MDAVKDAFHMNGGEGEYSYAKNSNGQSGIISIIKPLIDKAVSDYFTSAAGAPSIDPKADVGSGIITTVGIADLGCSSGPNTWKAVSHIIDAVYAAVHRGRAVRPSEVVVYLNDLPGNDFNNVFASVPRFLEKRKEGICGEEEFGPCFVVGVPGSFYGRLFPTRSLHFVHSASSLHWLSKVPLGLGATDKPRLNKGKIYLSKSSPKAVLDAYSNQFKEDFFNFLRSRSVEMVPGGRMVLTFIGRRLEDPLAEDDHYLYWDLLARSFITLISRGLVEEDKLNSFNVPYYSPSPHEVKRVVEGEGSFEIDQLEAFDFPWNGNLPTSGTTTTTTKVYSSPREDGGRRLSSRTEKITKAFRAVLEGLFKHHFGKDQGVMDELFMKYGEMLDCSLYEREPKSTFLTASFVRKMFD